MTSHLFNIDGAQADAMVLLREGRSDEEVERQTGLSLLEVINLRAELATRSAGSRGSSLSSEAG